MSQNKPLLPRPSVPRRVLAAAVTTALVGAVGVTAVHHATQDGITPTAATTNPVTPGNFGGWAFDQCQAPSQKAMDTWLADSPFLGVGIYVSGDERGCRNQTYLTSTWVKNQLAKGWKLLPITFGPQASCNPRFPRYAGDVRINATPGTAKNYAAAKTQGIAEARSAVADAKALGITPGSTMFYDLEAFDTSNTNCRESALKFLSGWTYGIHELGYVSGVYSSAGSGLKALDQARIERPKAFSLPDQVWIADWDGKATTTSSYISSSGWQHARVKQYQGGHYETYGGVKIDIDRDYANLGQGIVAPKETPHCGGINLDLTSFPALNPASKTTPSPAAVKALKCLLSLQGYFTYPVNDGSYGIHLEASVHRWKQAHKWAAVNAWYRRDWLSLLAAGTHPILKFGSAGEDVRTLQRSLDVIYPSLHLPINGAFTATTAQAVKAYQKEQKLTANGVVQSTVWGRMAGGFI